MFNIIQHLYIMETNYQKFLSGEYCNNIDAEVLEMIFNTSKLLGTLHFIVAENLDGIIVGFTSIRNDGYLHSMFINKDHQGEGIATALLKQIETYAEQQGIKRNHLRSKYHCTSFL